VADRAGAPASARTGASADSAKRQPTGQDRDHDRFRARRGDPTVAGGQRYIPEIQGILDACVRIEGTRNNSQFSQSHRESTELLVLYNPMRRLLWPWVLVASGERWSRWALVWWAPGGMQCSFTLRCLLQETRDEKVISRRSSERGARAAVDSMRGFLPGSPDRRAGSPIDGFDSPIFSAPSSVVSDAALLAATPSPTISVASSVVDPDEFNELAWPELEPEATTMGPRFGSLGDTAQWLHWASGGGMAGAQSVLVDPAVECSVDELAARSQHELASRHEEMLAQSRHELDEERRSRAEAECARDALASELISAANTAQEAQLRADQSEGASRQMEARLQQHLSTSATAQVSQEAALQRAILAVESMEAESMAAQAAPKPLAAALSVPPPLPPTIPLPGDQSSTEDEPAEAQWGSVKGNKAEAVANLSTMSKAGLIAQLQALRQEFSASKQQWCARNEELCTNSMQVVRLLQGAAAAKCDADNRLRVAAEELAAEQARREAVERELVATQEKLGAQKRANADGERA
jgi:hypothetical protein